MDTAPHAALRRPELVTDIEASRASEPARALAVMAVYQLSEAGRKASLLSGGDGRALQQLKVQVPTSRLHLVTVDPQGTARLKLRPRFELDADHQVVRTDAVPTYDAPPTLEDLFREAARNHELERVYHAERNAARTKRREAERERRAQIAQAFLADTSQRALVHPTPSPKRCTLATGQGRIVFDVSRDEGVARDVPPEAHRRFRAARAAKKEKDLRYRAAQMASHEEKKRYIAEWMSKHGTPEQRDRQTAGMLSMEEAVEAITDHVFAALADQPLYQRDGIQHLRAHLAALGRPADVVVRPGDVVVTNSDATAATSRQWQMIREVQAKAPDAKVALRAHALTCPKHPAPPLLLHGVLVTQTFGPFTLRREVLGSG